MAGVIGVGGSTDIKLQNPLGVALDPQTRSLYITDSGNKCIRVLTQAAMQSSSTPTMPTFASSLICPTDVVVDSRGNVYFTDQCANKVYVASSSGSVSILHFIE